MGKPQITVRLSPSLLVELNQHIEPTDTSKTDVVVSVIAKELVCANLVLLSQRMAEVERMVEELLVKLILILKAELLEGVVKCQKNISLKISAMVLV